MVCPFCLHTKTDVYNTRPTKKTNGVWRRRRCLACKKEFTTTESIDLGTVLSVNKKAFSHTKLLTSVLGACDHRADQETAATYITQTVEQALYKIGAKKGHTISSRTIAEQTLKTLKNYDVAAYVKYLSYHSTQLDARTIKRQLKSTS